MTVLSVIISTHNRASMLADLLDDLARQRNSPAFEVVVVDDGSTDDTAAVAAARESALMLRYVRQENQGLAAARNAGARLATGAILAYLDDDVIVPPDWAAAVVAGFDDPDVAALAGRIVVHFESEVPNWVVPGLHALLGEYDLGDHSRRLEPPEFPRGGHCAIRAAAWKELGGLDPSLGWGSSANVPNEEKELFLRLARSGGAMQYWPAATVRHRILGERLQKPWFRQRMRAQGVGDVLVEGVPPGWRRSAAIGRELLRFLRAAPILLRGIAVHHGPFSAVVWWDYCRGRLGALRRSIE